MKNILRFSDGLPCPLQHPVKPREVSLSLDFLSISHSRTSSLLSSVAVPELPSPMVPDKSPQVSCDWWRAGHVTSVLTSDWSAGAAGDGAALPRQQPPRGPAPRA